MSSPGDMRQVVIDDIHRAHRRCLLDGADTLAELNRLADLYGMPPKSLHERTRLPRDIDGVEVWPTPRTDATGPKESAIQVGSPHQTWKDPSWGGAAFKTFTMPTFRQ